MTTADYANELRDEMRARIAAGEQLHPERAAFVAALEARGTDARTKMFKHYDRIIKWMIANWPDELDPFKK